MRALLRLAALTVAVIVTSSSASAAEPPRMGPPPGLSRLAGVSGTALGIATFDAARPSRTKVAALRDLGLKVQPMRRLPLALVQGPVSAMVSAVSAGAAKDVYPNEELTFLSATTNRTIAVDAVQGLGFTGEGMTVAVMDSGIDATHPDLADHVVHNITFIGPEKAGLAPEMAGGPLFVAVDDGPYSNTDTSGHGTWVAGIIAADGTTSREQTGVAPEAELVGYALGDATGQTWAAVSAYDDLLDHPERGVDVINNSWGGQMGFFDTNHPINVATKSAAEAGMVVVFAAGNSGTNGGDLAEMTMSEFQPSVPWLISVAGVDNAGKHWAASSNGLALDNATASDFEEGHARFEGDGIGIYRPTVSAPGVGVVSSCSLTGPDAQGASLQDTNRPCRPGGTASWSGTSGSAPHVAGVATLLRQARQDLTVEEVGRVLEATARPVPGRSLMHVGYGVTDARLALDLVLRSDFDDALAQLHAAASVHATAGRLWSVVRSELWRWGSAPVTADTVSVPHDVRIEVPAATDAVKLTLNYPYVGSDYVGTTPSSYTAVLLDAEGVEVGRTKPYGPPFWQGRLHGPTVTRALIDLRDKTPAFGEWTVRVTGGYNAQDPYTLRNSPLRKVVSLQAALLEAL